MSEAPDHHIIQPALPPFARVVIQQYPAFPTPFLSTSIPAALPCTQLSPTTHDSPATWSLYASSCRRFRSGSILHAVGRWKPVDGEVGPTRYSLVIGHWVLEEEEYRDVGSVHTHPAQAYKG